MGFPWGEETVCTLYPDTPRRILMPCEYLPKPGQPVTVENVGQLPVGTAVHWTFPTAIGSASKSNDGNWLHFICGKPYQKMTDAEVVAAKATVAHYHGVPKGFA
jgi:hypothetical protein